MYGIADKQLIKNSSYINGNWLKSDTSFIVTNPANNSEIIKVSNAGVVETQLAVKAARNALAMWSDKSANERAKLLRTWFNLMMSKDCLLQTSWLSYSCSDIDYEHNISNLLLCW